MENLLSFSQPVNPLANKTKRGRIDFVAPKLVASLDRCQLSIRDSVYIIQAVVEALGLSFDDYPIKKSSIQRARSQVRKVRAESIKSDFQENVPQVVTAHWDGKLFVSRSEWEKLRRRTPADYYFIRGEGTTCSNIKIRKLLIQQVTTSPDILLFKKFRENRKNINSSTIEKYTDFAQQYFCDTVISTLVTFPKNELNKSITRDHYRELIELAIILLGGDYENKIKIRPPGAMDQTRWLARATYCLKICLLSQFQVSVKDKLTKRKLS